ncbi:hypothetical protein L6452_30977 [Arctium lappa]|uniref:Uncharacterized protein n=1 Tax=Arctium lappa TaxID=4217 RepID=A0ACB8ZKU2_ARCLA|nr:hypothetical protein L6452_30977 [Arctium lappa]
MVSKAAGVMEKPIVIDRYQPQKPQALKCPRCDSSNTKFCYYNNYSLSQPRHFCKACKRYWTRGGTLRNVPVGGGCRKNKRLKIPPTTATTTTHVASTSQPLDHNPNLDHLSLVYGLSPQNPNYNTLVSGYDFSQPQMSDLGLRFSPSDPGSGVVVNHSHNSSSYPSSMFAGSTSSSTSAPLMASILASGFQQQQRFMDWSNHFQGQNNNDQLEAVASSNPNSLLWNTQTSGGGGGWFDPTNNIDSSVPSLI